MLNFLKNFSAKSKPQSIALLDLGTSSVKAAIVDLTTFTPTLLGFGEELFKNGTILSGLVSDLNDFQETAGRALRKASLACGFTPPGLVFPLSGEFVKSVTVDLEVKRPTAGRLGRGEKDKIEKEIKRQVAGEIKKEFSRISGDPSPEVESFYERVVSFESSDGIGLESLAAVIEPTFKVSVLASFASSPTRKLLEKISRGLNKKNLLVFDQTVGLLDLIKKTRGNFSAVLVDVGFQVTDVCLVSLGKIVGERTIPLGGRDLTINLCQKLGLTTEDAEERKRRGEFSPSEAADFFKLWTYSLDQSLTEITQGSKFARIPVYFFGRGIKPENIREALGEFVKGSSTSFLNFLDVYGLDKGLTPEINYTGADNNHLSFLPLLSAVEVFQKSYVPDKF
ncbi:MAG: pilus assembly protein PilM [Patescibacteria group bacterium]|nr:pilus assembly protein PilM [Patescibacteria group bacterium]